MKNRDVPVNKWVPLLQDAMKKALAIEQREKVDSDLSRYFASSNKTWSTTNGTLFLPS
jgi:hypothetical protein